MGVADAFRLTRHMPAFIGAPAFHDALAPMRDSASRPGRRPEALSGVGAVVRPALSADLGR